MCFVLDTGQHIRQIDSRTACVAHFGRFWCANVWLVAPAGERHVDQRATPSPAGTERVFTVGSLAQCGEGWCGPVALASAVGRQGEVANGKDPFLHVGDFRYKGLRDEDAGEI